MQSVVYGIGIEEHDKEGRVITLEYEKFYLVTVYTPNSQSELRRLEYRMQLVYVIRNSTDLQKNVRQLISLERRKYFLLFPLS